MTSKLESSAAVLEKPKEEQTDREQKEARSTARIDQAIKACRALCETPFISDRTKTEYESMLEDLRKQEKVEYIEENITYLERTINNAKHHFDVYQRQLDDAVRNKWISSTSRGRWIERFFNGNLLEMDRKVWLFNTSLEDAFPSILKRWEEAAKKRQEVDDLAKELGVTAKDNPELADVLNQETFLSLHYKERAHKAAKAKAVLLAMKADKKKGGNSKEMKQLLAFAEAEMNEWAEAGIMHPLKIGEWLERTMKSKDPKAFVAYVLYPFKKNWAKVRSKFDRRTAEIHGSNSPLSRTIISPEAFLLLDYGKRVSYCALLDSHSSALHADVRRLASLKLRISSALSSNDPTGAERALTMARAICPEDEELDYLNTLIDQKKKEARQEAGGGTPDALKASITTLINRVPVPLRELYATAAERGSGTLNALMRSVHNRVRWYQAGGLNERTEASINTEGSIMPVEDESPFVETENSPTVVVLNRLTNSATDRDESADLLDESEYTLIPPIPYAAQYDVVMSIHTPLKHALKALEARGLAYGS